MCFQADGVARPSFGSRCLENIDALGNIEHQEWVIKNTAASMYGGQIIRSVHI
jgi:hypothetical protein